MLRDDDEDEEEDYDEDDVDDNDDGEYNRPNFLYELLFRAPAASR